MATHQGSPLVGTDDYGVMRIGKTRVSLDSVVIAWLDGESADEICRNYPSLSLEQTYGAIAYYLGHRQHVDEYLKQQRKYWEQMRKAHEKPDDPLLLRLRALKHDRAGKTP
jgi:uncharacterized protein (DUF433 family)